MIYTRPKTKCAQCPLAGRALVYGRGEFTSKIAFIGEAPGREEDEQRMPFVGQAGRLLSWALGEVGLFRNHVYLTNVLLCRPPDNDITSIEAKKGLYCCRAGFDAELAMLRDKGVTTLVALGTTAMRALDVEGRITAVRGSVYEKHGFRIMPTYHPSYLNRMGYTKSSGRVDHKVTWLNDLRKAVSIAQGYTAPSEKFVIDPTEQEIKDFLAATKAGPDPLLALDIETTSLRRDKAKVVCIGFARDAENAICIPWMPGIWGTPWSNGAKHRVRKLIDRLLALPLVLQNAGYDIPILQRNGFHATFANVRHDVMLLHHAITPEMPHNLGYIVSVHGQTPYWKEDFLDRNVSILDLPLDDLSTYNCRDCVVLHQVLPELLAELHALGPGTEAVYERQSMPMLEIVSSMKDHGIIVSPSRLAAYKQTLATDLDRTRDTLLTEFKLPAGFNPSSTDEVKYLLYGETLKGFPEPGELSAFNEHLEYEIKCAACKKKTWVRSDVHYCPKCSSAEITVTERTRMKADRKPGTKVHERLLYLAELQQVPSLALPPRWVPPRTEKNVSAIDSEARLSLRVAVQNRLAALREQKGDTQDQEHALARTLRFLELYDAYQHTGKLLSTYTEYPTWSDGRVHTDFLIAGTATGRLASRNPNLQNLPKREIQARTVFVPAKGNVFLSGDYTNLEVYVLAWVSGETVLQEILLSGRNVHDENTRLFGVEPGDPLWSLARRAAKIFQFALIQYGGTERAIYEKVLLECPDLTITFSEFRAIKRRYMAKYRTLALWQEEQKRFARENRYIETAFGRRRTLFGATRDIEKQALNTPIQGTAADIINLAMIRVYERLRTSPAKLVLQIHDQLVAETPSDLVPEIHELLREEMSRPVTLGGQVVTLPVDFEVGPTLGDLKEYRS